VRKYLGAIVDDGGFIVFEFITRYSNTREEAEAQARHIRDAIWKSYPHSCEQLYYVIEEV
jgi:hypothetical protein